MVPLPPFAAVIVVLPQKAPLPAAVTVAANALTVTIPVILQPVGIVYVIPATPAANPFTIPVEEPIVAVPVAPEVQEPPAVPSVRLVEEPIHTAAVPVIAAGRSLTVTVNVVIQPVPKEYVIVAVPRDEPVT